MIKIAAHLSKKVPAEVAFSSRQVGASLEIEVSDSDKSEQIKTRLRELYTVLRQSVEEQIAGTNASAGPASATSAPVNRLPTAGAQTGSTAAPAAAKTTHTNGGNGGNGRSTAATQAQKKAIFAISKALGLEVSAALAPYGVTDSKDLTIKQASELIDQLKARQNVRY